VVCQVQETGLTDANGCTSTATSNVVINAIPTAPVSPLVGTITQPTCTTPTGSVVLSGLPSTGNWTITGSPSGTATGTGTTGSVTGLAPGNYTFKVSNVSGCSSTSTVQVTINAQPYIPTNGGIIEVAGNGPVCSNVSAKFTISKGISGEIIKYTINGGTEQNVILNVGGIAEIDLGNQTITQTIVLTKILSTSGCESTITSLKSTASITINPTSTKGSLIEVSNNGSFCDNGIGVFTVIGGDANGSMKYRLNGGQESSASFDALGRATISTGFVSTNQIIRVTSVTTSKGCTSSLITSQNLKKATLSLKAWNKPDGFGPHSQLTKTNDFSFYRVTSSWSDNQLTWLNQPNSVGTNSVSLPGTNDPAKDYNDIDLTNLTKEILNSNNFGYMMKQDQDEYYSAINFCSSDYIDPARRPKLMLVYDNSGVDDTVYISKANDAFVHSTLGYNTTNYATNEQFSAVNWTFDFIPGNIHSYIRFDLSSYVNYSAIDTLIVNTSSTKGSVINVTPNGPFCVNGTGVFTVSGGESNGSVKYKIDNGTEQTQVLDNLGSAIINIGNITTSKSIVLTSIVTSSGCSSVITSATASATITINPTSTKGNTISVTANGPFCVNGTGVFTVSGGESNGSVKYKIDNGTEQIQVLDNSGIATINIGNITTSKSIVLTSIVTSSGCSSVITSATASATITINPTSTKGNTISVTANGPFCVNGTGAFTVSGGESNGSVKYKIDNGTEQTQVLDNLGSATINIGNITTSKSIVLTSIVTSSGCGSVITSATASATITINPTSTKGNTISVTANGPFCVNGTGVFTVSGGESNGSVKYKIDNGAEQTQVLDNSGSATINIGNITTSKSIVLTSIVTSSGCGSVITSATASATITINPTSTKGNTIRVTANGPFCVNGTGVFTVSGGESNGSVKYKLDGGAEQTQVLDNLGSATINVGNITTSKSIVLTSIVTSSGCGSVITSATASATITINPTSTKGNTISVTANGPFCVNGTGIFTVSGGESNGSVKYTLDGGAEQTQLLDNSGSATINIGNITTNKSIVLTSIVTSSVCSSVITSATASATITINPTSTKGNTISVTPNGPFCVNGTGVFTVSGGESNGSVKYKLDGGAEQTQVLDNLGSATINVGNITTSKSIVLTSIVTSSGCSSVITSATSTAIITVNQISTSGSSIEVQGNGPICRTDNAIFKIVKGQPNETVTYTVNGVETSTVLNNLGERLIDLGIISLNKAIVLTKITTTTGCESAINSSKKSTSIEINLPNVPVADISQIICAVDNKQLKDIKFTAPQNNQNGAFIFRYKFDPILASLPISTFIKDTTYIVKYNDGQCESDEILLTVKTNKGGDAQNGSYNSCAIEEPLVGQLIPNGNNITWYSTVNSSIKLDKLTTKLSNGVYYYSSKNAQGCESVTRGEVVVTLNKGSNPFPSLNPALVVPIEFCLSANPQIADLSSKIESQLTGQNVFANKMVWYLSATDKVAYNGKLDDLKSYFVTYVDASSCESIDRFEVPVKLINFQGITTMNLDQSFCKENSVVINDIDFTPNIYSDFEIKNELGELVTDKYQKLTTQFYELRLIDKSNLLNCVSSKPSKLKISISESNLIKVQPIASLILKNSNEIILTATPKGGTFSGEGVKGNYFYPYQCKLGTKKITYNYKTQNSKCDGSASIITIIVDSTENKCHIYDTIKVTKYDTIKTLTSVTDTLKIKLKLTTGTFSKQYNNIKIYPNPTISDVMIDYGNYKTMQGYYLTITDINGKKLNVFPIDQQITKINLSSFGGPGIYFFNFHDINSNIIETKKIVLE